MEVPHYDEWLRFADVARSLNVTLKRLHKCRRGVVKSATGASVVLKAWRTPGGWVTTEKDLREFLSKLNV